MTTLRMATFADHCVPASELRYRGDDRLMVPTGEAFDNALFASAIGKGRRISRDSGSLRGSMPLVAKTEVAALLDLMLKTNPYVLEIRCHYPYCVPTRADPLIIDRMVTVERWKARGEAHLHAIMLSPSGLSAVRNHLERDQVTYELFDASQISPLAIHNADQMYGFARQRNVLDATTRQHAAQLALKLNLSERRRQARQSRSTRTYRRCTLERLMRRLGKQLGVSEDEASAWLGVGLILGYVCLPEDYELNPVTPLRLAPPLVQIRA